VFERIGEGDDSLLAGRTAFMAPEVDGRVLLRREIAEPGQMVRVKILEAETYDLVGVTV